MSNFQKVTGWLWKYFDVEHTELMTNQIFSDLLPVARLWTYISNLSNADFEFINSTENDEEDEKKEKENEQKEFYTLDSLITTEAKKMLLVLCYLQNNPFWRYLVSNFYWRFVIREKNEILFREKFPIFLRYLVAFTFSAMLSPKDYKNAFYKQRFKVIIDDISLMTQKAWWELPEENDSFKNIIKYEMNGNAGSAGQMSRALLLLHAYLDPQQELVRDNFDIEHIFPQDFKKMCKSSPTLMEEYGMTVDNIEDCLQSFGNKLALEKKINISASNNPWLIKSKIYRGDEPWNKNNRSDEHKTVYQEALYLAQLPQVVKWTKKHIDMREDDFLQKILLFLRDPEHDFSDWKRPDYAF